MSKFCKACNKQVDDSLSFCPTCGGQLETVADSKPVAANDAIGKAKDVAGDLVSKVKSDKKLLIGAGVAAVVVLILIFGLGIKMLDPGAGVAKKYWKAYIKEDADKIVKLLHEDMYEDEDDVVDAIEEEFDDNKDADREIKKFKIVESVKYSEDQLEDLAEVLENIYDIDEDDVKAAKHVWARMVVEYDGEESVTYTSATVIKIEGKWYIYSY